MFAKFCLILAFVFGFSLHVQAHAIINPALGVNGNPQRNQVQRPSTRSPCGNVNVAQTLATVKPVVAQADGTFTTTVVNFNGGRDGSRQVTGTVDATASGNSFKANVQVTKNGDLAPTNVGSQQITAKLPAGTKCTGGKTGNLCLVSFKTAGNFGNCIAVQQSGAAAAVKANTNPKRFEIDIRAVGTRAARAFRQAMEDWA